jgi:hypothetical protein
MRDYASMPGFGPARYSPEQIVAPGRREAESVLMRIPGVQGVGEGHDEIGDPAWVAYVCDSSVASHLPSRVGDRAVIALNSGEISILPVK